MDMSVFHVTEVFRMNTGLFHAALASALFVSKWKKLSTNTHNSCYGHRVYRVLPRVLPYFIHLQPRPRGFTPATPAPRRRRELVSRYAENRENPGGGGEAGRMDPPWLNQIPMGLASRMVVI